MKNILIQKLASRNKDHQRRRLFYVTACILIFFSIYVLFSIRTEVNQSFNIAFKYFLLPAFPFSFYLIKYFIPKYIDNSRNGLGIELFFSASLTAMIVMGPVNAGIVAGNAWFSNQKSQIFSGPIIDKWISYSRGKSYNVRFAPREIARAVWLTISEDEYLNLEIGKQYQRQMTLGAYGVLYY